ncbi:outer membrane beta-barrel protein [Tellurirhabdus rosea]|uniref:outer membrane beta-barrel protein n=1 Tax=Tellurirhabdus rosea TaxID=2674997 RepID=UPI00225579E6|nr:outer membrane beta-barrel protein [Tellurirhabdus rosea]
MSIGRKGVSSLFYTSLLLFGLSPLASQGQGLGNSPYSSQGIGELYGDNNVWNRGMGGLGVAYANPFHLNSANPALLVRNRSTIFEVGLLGQAKRISDRLQSQRDFGGNLSYLNLAFPVTGKWSAGFGLRPYSFIDYNTTVFRKVEPATIYDSRTVYTGRGGLNKATITNGFQVGKNVFLGLEAGFMFGNAVREANSQVIINGLGDLSTDIVVSRTTQSTYSDLVFKFGGAWRPKLSKNWNLNLGATFEPQTKIRARETEAYEQRQAQQVISLADTIRSNQKGTLVFPSKLRAGVVLEKNLNIAVGAEVSYEKWSNYRTVTGANPGLRDSYAVNAGIEFLPKTASSNYLNLINYRFGVGYGQLPNVVNGKALNDVNASLGIALPVGRFVNSISLSVTAGQRGNTSFEGQIRERYTRIGLSLSLNDRWFQRFRVD